MCAIAGIIHKDRTVAEEEIRRMCDRMVSRGPDGEGVHIDGRVGLGHRRLSIIDLKTGDQPMFSEDRSLVIVFNGEIYNFKELRRELETGSACRFATTSDTEVILTGYRVWGIGGILARLEGMFAFAIYDKSDGRVYIARDRFGEKPLYYRADGDSLTFASELKAFAELLPAKTRNFSKMGFAVPIDYWFKTVLKAEFSALTSREAIERQGLFDYDYIRRIFDEHLAGKQNHKALLWNIYVFQKWYNSHVTATQTT